MTRDDEPDSDATWLSEQRAEVESYLAAERVAHAGVASEPDWYVPGVLAIWPVRSGVAPEAFGWWVVSGDVPTDYVTAAPGMDAQGALAVIAARWQAAAARMAQGLSPEGWSLGTPADWPTLGPMLGSRADTLARWAAKAELWT